MGGGKRTPRCELSLQPPCSRSDLVTQGLSQGWGAIENETPSPASRRRHHVRRPQHRPPLWLDGIKRRLPVLVAHLYGVEKGMGNPRRRMTPMNPTDQFLKHAAECHQMAKATRNPASKATWNRMAERWLQCAERAKSQRVATHIRMPVRRQAVSSSAHY